MEHALPQNNITYKNSSYTYRNCVCKYEYFPYVLIFFKNSCCFRLCLVLFFYLKHPCKNYFEGIHKKFLEKLFAALQSKDGTGGGSRYLPESSDQGAVLTYNFAIFFSKFNVGGVPGSRALKGYSDMSPFLQGKVMFSVCSPGEVYPSGWYPSL